MTSYLLLHLFKIFQEALVGGHLSQAAGEQKLKASIYPLCPSWLWCVKVSQEAEESWWKTRWEQGFTDKGCLYQHTPSSQCPEGGNPSSSIMALFHPLGPRFLPTEVGAEAAWTSSQCDTMAQRERPTVPLGAVTHNRTEPQAIVSCQPPQLKAFALQRHE